jgi:hypothetical protein
MASSLLRGALALAIGLSGVACLPCGDTDDGNDAISIDVAGPPWLEKGDYRVVITAGADVAEGGFVVGDGATECVDLCALRPTGGASIWLSGVITERFHDSPGFRIELTARGRGPEQLGVLVTRDEQVLVDVTAAPPYYDQERCSELRAANLHLAFGEPAP